MISEAPDFAALAAFGAQVCVIGGGPVGLVTALALARRGRRVLLLESGGRAAGAAAQALSQAENLDPATHHAPEITVARRLGGASNLWGGRCLPFDPVDFAARPWLADLAGGLPAWPIGPEDLAPWLGDGLPDARRRRPGVRRAAARGGGRSGLRLREPRALEQPAADPGAARGRARRAARAHGRARDHGDGLRGRLRTGGSRPPSRMSRGGAGGGSPRRSSCWPPAATRARGSCSRRRRRRRSASAGRRGRSGAATWGMSTARSPTWCSRTRRCTTGSTSMSTAMAPTCGGGWCRRRRRRRRPASATSPSGRWCPRWRTRATGRGRCRRPSWRSRSGRSGGG